MRKIFKQRLLITSLAAAAAVLPFSGALGQQYEWDEEWYDPTDWFDDVNGVGVDGNVVDDYDADYYDNDFWTYDDYVYDYGYDYDAFDIDGIDEYYQWDPALEVWTVVAATEEDSKSAASMQKQSQSQSKNQELAEDVTTMRGTITGIARVNPKGADQQHTFIKMDGPQGKSILVDAGPKAEPAKMELKEGKQIQVRGVRAKFGGEQYVLVAQQISESPKGQQSQYGGRDSSQGQKKSSEQSTSRQQPHNQSSGQSNPQQGQSR